MRFKLFNIIVIITAIALSGIIVTQFFWVKDALNMKNDQFYQNAGLGLKRVVNQLMSLQNDSATAVKFITSNNEGNYHSQFIQSLDPVLIQDMINSEFSSLELCKAYHYGIYEKNTEEFIMVSDSQHINEILVSEYQAPISCIFQDDQFVLAVYFSAQEAFVFNKMQLYIILSALFMLIVIAGFWFVASSHLKQKRLSEMKTDFVNNMTHELKTPIATISVTSEMLMKEEIQRKPDKISKYAEVIYSENQRLRNQVDHVLNMAILDRGDNTLKMKKLDVHEIIHFTSDRFLINVSQRNGVIHQRLNAANSIIYADRDHISNVLNNLLDNANKYSPDKPEITISTHSNKKGVFISIDDRGIGMEEENIKDIFKRFHRISTGDVHDVKGFGIGLFYVKTILEAHGGSITVNSKPGKGSCFVAFIPFKNSKQRKLMQIHQG